MAGELYDPSGTLTGGSRQQTSPVLAELQKLKASREELKKKEVGFCDILKFFRVVYDSDCDKEMCAAKLVGFGCRTNFIN